MCPNCGSYNTLIDTMCVLTSYPAQYAYKCRNCNKHWSSSDYRRQSYPLPPLKSWIGTEIEEPNYIGQMGWICPKCGGVYSPTMHYCMHCTQPKAPTITCIDFNEWTKDKEKNTIVNNLGFNEQHGE